MDLSQQEPRSAAGYEKAATLGETCMDCGRGIAHRLPKGVFDIDLDRLVQKCHGGARASSC